ncbi:unnamed protein product [Ambrosiozyma monospora]|uniref:Unnamed protein product n=1 Tax=Ambrosiozyma monospora TaxID=43982 RepID=A0A9W6SYQ0_AMBMO|nr:unnamed protein product [Ambrosiozyma monospora]
MWSDPSPEYDTEEFDSNDLDSYFRDNTDRHCSYFYSYKATCKFLENNGLLSVIRAHQAQDAGYRMYRVNDANGFPSVITLFSAPNYCGTYRNKAAALIYDGATFNIKQFVSSPTPYHLPDFMDVFEWSLPFVAEKVLDILVAVLNICSEDELLQKTPLARTVVSSLDELPEKPTKPAVGAAPVSDANLEARAALRRKLLSIGRMSRMFSILREESEKVEDLRNMAGGQLPKGILVDGREALHNQLLSFGEARDADLRNEGLPPTSEELVEKKRRKSMEQQKFIEDGDLNVTH